MELHCLLGLKCDDFVMVAADQIKIQNIYMMDDDDEKLHKIDDHTIIGMIGENGDTLQFLQYLKRNAQLYRLRNSFPMHVDAVAHFASRTLSDANLQLHRYNTKLLIAGFDGKESHLYLLDELGSCIKMSAAALGMPGQLSRTILDRYHMPNMTEAEAYEVMNRCTQEIQQRLIIQLPKFQVSVVSKDGVKQMPPLLRSQKTGYNTKLLIAGSDGKESRLYLLDKLGSCIKPLHKIM